MQILSDVVVIKREEIIIFLFLEGEKIELLGKIFTLFDSDIENKKYLD